MAQRQRDLNISPKAIGRNPREQAEIDKYDEEVDRILAITEAANVEDVIDVLTALIEHLKIDYAKQKVP